VRLGLVAGRDDERRDVLHERRRAAEHRMLADLHELMDARHAAHDRPIADDDVPRARMRTTMKFWRSK
jgi:hypothetical protein